MTSYGNQDINQSYIKAIFSDLISDFLSHGSKVHLFEKEVADYLGAIYSEALNSPTSDMGIVFL